MAKEFQPFNFSDPMAVTALNEVEVEGLPPEETIIKTTVKVGAEITEGASIEDEV